MKVLKDNYTKENTEENVKIIKPYPRDLTCELCGSELQYEKSDLHIGAFGCAYLRCPLCGRDNALDGEDEMTLTADNIEFPTHFYHTSEENGAVDKCNNEEIKERIRNAINYFRKNKDEFVWQSQCGNLSLIVFRYDGNENYEVILTKDYYSTCIPFEDKDYKF